MSVVVVLIVQGGLACRASKPRKSLSRGADGFDVALLPSMCGFPQHQGGEFSSGAVRLEKFVAAR